MHLKGQSNQIFDPQFISSFVPIWAPDKQAKVYSNSVSISLRYSNFSIEKNWLRAVSYCADKKKNFILEH